MLDTSLAQATEVSRDAGTMTWDDLIKDPTLPQSFKDFIIFQLQRSGQSRGMYIGISDFGRLSVDEEIELNRKKREQSSGSAASFAEEKAEFIDILRQQRDQAGKELDKLNQLLKDMPEGSDAREEVEDYRNLLRGYYNGLKWMTDKAKSATSRAALTPIQNAFEASYQFFMRNRHVMVGALNATFRGLGYAAEAAASGLGSLVRVIPFPF